MNVLLKCGMEIQILSTDFVCLSKDIAESP